MKGTKDLVPFEDNFRPEGITLPLSISLDLSKEHKYKVIDCDRGICYYTDIEDQNEIVRQHENRIGFSGSMPYRFDYVIKREYMYYEQEIEGMLVFRVFNFRPCMKSEVQGFYEHLRVLFTKDEAFVEDRDGAVTPLTPGKCFNPRGIIRKAIAMPRKDIGTVNKIAYALGFDYLKYTYEHLGGLSLKGVTWAFFKKQQKCVIRSNVPDVIRKDLIETPVFQKKNHINCAVRKIDDTTACFEEAINRENMSIRAYFTKDRIFWFKKNPFTDKWYSSCEKFCVSLKYATIYVQDALAIKDIIKGTWAEKYTVPNDNPSSIIESLLYQKEYLSIEQAYKMERSDIGFMLIKGLTGYYGSSDAFSKDQNLPEVLGISGKQIRFLAKNYYMSLPEFKNVMALAKSKNIPVECILPNMVYVGNYIISVIKEFEDNGKSCVNFFKALAKRERYEVSRILQEFQDSINMRNRLNVYMRAHDIPERSICVKPSLIHEVHETYRQLLNQMNAERRAESDKEWNISIERQKESLKDLEYSDENYSIILPKNANDIRQEGTVLQHCVGSYVALVARKETTILFLRKNKEMDKRLLTIELNNGNIRQCFGLHDTYNKDKNVGEFIRSWAKKHNFGISCPVYRPA